jgi:menaquinone-dependent protoporphyrinogen IX oxidase
MNILLAYSSGYGVTQEISEKVGQILAEEPSFQVQVRSMEQIKEVVDHEVIILAGSVRADMPLATILDFLALHRLELATKKLAVFLVCLMANSDAGRAKVKDEYLPVIHDKYPELEFISAEAFGGKIDFDKLNPVMQMLMRRVLEKTGIPTSGSVDTRDWDFIASWAQDLKHKLLAV